MELQTIKHALDPRVRLARALPDQGLAPVAGLPPVPQAHIMISWMMLNRNLAVANPVAAEVEVASIPLEVELLAHDPRAVQPRKFWCKKNPWTMLLITMDCIIKYLHFKGLRAGQATL